MFEWCSSHEMTISSPGTERRPTVALRHEVDAVGRALGQHDRPRVGRIEERRRLGARAFVQRRRPLAQQMRRRGGCSRSRGGSRRPSPRARRRGFWLVFALSRYTSGLPWTRSDRIGKSARTLLERRMPTGQTAAAEGGHAASSSARSLASCAYSSASSATRSGSILTRSRMSPAKAWISMSRASK